MKLTLNCEICGKPKILKDSITIGGETMVIYECGHTFVENPANEAQVTEDLAKFNSRLTSCKGDKLAFDYQKDALEFIQNPIQYLENRSIPYRGKNIGYNCLIADQMGLGKTIEGLLSLVPKMDSNPDFKCLILVKSATLWQWIKEFKEWATPLPLGIFLIEGSKSWIPPAFKSYICSMDTFARICGSDTGMKKIEEMNFNMLIVDEIHSFKNASSKRTQALISFIKKISHREITKTSNFLCASCETKWSEEIRFEVDVNRVSKTEGFYHHTKCPKCGTQQAQRAYSKDFIDSQELSRMGLIFLSGTPIKNRADEYFVPLNILAPEVFPSLDRFRKDYLIQDGSKWKGIKPYMLDEFRAKIAPFVIRRERKDVLPDLPRFQRTFNLVSIQDEGIKKAYNDQIDQLIEKSNESGGNLSQSEVMDNIMAMRRIIGMAKVKAAADYIEEFLEDTEDDKIAIGIHHHAVRDAIVYELGKRGIEAIRIDAGKDIQWKVDEWRARADRRVAVISQLGGGVGLNLQFCHSLLNIERQWNSADEEQLEDRFNRVGQDFPVTAEYLVLMGTIDSWFSTMVEEKRIISGETFGINFDPTSSKETMNEMLDWAMRNKIQ